MSKATQTRMWRSMDMSKPGSPIMLDTLKPVLEYGSKPCELCGRSMRIAPGQIAFTHRECRKARAEAGLRKFKVGQKPRSIISLK